jgi:hypothetical protein
MKAPIALLLLHIAATGLHGQSQTVTSLTAAPASANMGQAVTLQATVTPSNATGKVTFYDGTEILGVAPVANGVANFTTISIGYGKRSLTARYGGDGNYSGSVSAPFAERIVTKPGGALVQGTGTGPMSANQFVAALADLNHDQIADVVTTVNHGNAVFVYLGNGDGTFQPGQSYLLGTTSQVVAVADINMDGIPDLLVGGLNGLSSLIGNGDGTFTAGAAITSTTNLWAVRVADFNGDGKPDVALLAYAASSVEILLGNGDGTFQTTTPITVSLANAATICSSPTSMPMAFPIWQ